MIRSRSPRNFAHRSRMGTFAHALWAARARETMSGNRDAGVLSKCASTSPVAGLIEGSVSIGMAVAAINGILTDFGAVMWIGICRPRTWIRAIEQRGSLKGATPLRVELRP